MSPGCQEKNWLEQTYSATQLLILLGRNLETHSRDHYCFYYRLSSETSCITLVVGGKVQPSPLHSNSS